MSTPPLHRDDPALLDALRDDLRQARFTVEGIEDFLGPLAARALDREQTIPALRVTQERPGPLATLVRLLTLGDAVDEDRAEEAFPTLTVAGATRLGLVRQEGSGVIATCDLRPYAVDGHLWWVASDLSEIATRSPLRADHVLGVGGASTTLASWTPRPHVRRALDLGTGCGVQALPLATHAEEVVVTDLSQRALDYAAFNAALNGQDWQVRHGSMLDPVEGDVFDLVVSNPPFVITPRDAGLPVYEYRDAGAAGDSAVADLVRTVGRHLAPGGIAQLLGNWEVADADWRERVGGWVRDSGLDAWVVQREVQDAAEYAETWARDGGHHSATPEFATMYAAWLDDFAARGVSAVGFGVITLHRPRTDRDPFVDLVDVRGPVASPMGPHVLDGVRAREWLSEHDDEQVLAIRWRCADDVTEERWSRPGASDPGLIRLRQGGGLGRVIELDTVCAAFAGVADGELTAGQSLTAIAAVLDVPAAEVTAGALPTIRACIADGLLVPADGELSTRP
jgi:methylase of polypeptide subunit release factors